MFLSNINHSQYFTEDLVLESSLQLLNLDNLRESPFFTILKFSDAHYFGELWEGLRHGLGVMKYKSGRLFEGHWDNDMREGRGYERFANGHSY